MTAPRKTVLMDAFAPATFAFFARVADALEAMGYACRFITNSLDVFLSGRGAGRAISLVRTRDRFPDPLPTQAPVRDLQLVQLGLMGENAVDTIIQATLGHLRRNPALRNVDYCFIFAGNLPFQLALADHARRNGIRTVFFEIGNMPGKVFADPEGTNANAKLYRHPEILESFAAENSAYETWRHAYLTAKANAHVVPQAAQTRKSRSLSGKIERQVVYAANALGGVAQTPKLHTRHRRIRCLSRKSSRPVYDRVDLQAGPYVFFPMQVRIDAQTVLHSDIDILDGLRTAARAARERGRRLLVKPHPAESDGTVLDELRSARSECGFLLVNTNTFSLLNHAEAVYTLNSTVGLEALVLGKPVTFLARSYFNKLAANEIYLRNYIMEYLIDADFFATAPVSGTAALRMLERAAV